MTTSLSVGRRRGSAAALLLVMGVCLPGLADARADLFHQKSFDGSSMVGINLSGANLANAELDADLTGANLAGANLVQADFGGADLTGADLSGATIDADWSNTECPDGTNSDLVGYTCCGHHVGSPPASCQ